MNKIHKITKIALIFVLIGIFLYPDPGYTLRAPLIFDSAKIKSADNAMPSQIEINKYAQSILKEDSSDAAILSLQTDDHAIKNLSDDLSSLFNAYEGRALLRLIHHPSKSGKEIKTRQKMIGALKNLTNDERKILSESKNALYKLLISITNLLDINNRETLVSLADKNGYGAEKLAKFLGKGYKTGDNDSISEIREGIIGIEKHKDSISSFIKKFEKITDPLAKALLAELRNKSDKFRAPDTQDILLSLKEGHLNALSDLSKEAAGILNIVTKIGMLIEFAQFAENDGYAMATFNDNMPAVYDDGWNFMREKEGQVKNPSGKDAAIKLITGSNMSGKSFFLIQNLFMQIVGQSLGFIPAASGNLRIYDQIVFIDRAGTETMINLSAFGSEVKKWKDPFETIGKKSLYLVDEGFSTTSPDDQSMLLTGTSNFLRHNNAHAILATHNENFITSEQQKPDVVTYHFETIINKDILRQQDNDQERYDYDKKEPITFTHKIKDGFDDSKALEVAAQIGLQQNLITRSGEFLAEKFMPAVSPGSKILPKITAYSKEERSRLKKKRGSFLPFFPYNNALEERKDVPVSERESLPLEWKYAAGGHENTQYYGNEQRPKFEFEPVFALFSKDRDFSPWSIDYVDYGVLKNQDILEGVHRLIMVSPSRDPREILERQQMFRAISNDKTAFGEEYWKISEMLGQLNVYLKGLQLGAGSQLDRFNLYILLDALKDIGQDKTTKTRSELFLKILDVNLALNGTSLKNVGVEDDLAEIAEIWKLQKEIKAFSQELWFKPDKKDPDFAKKAKRLRAETKRFTGKDNTIYIEYGAGEIVTPILFKIFEKATGTHIHKDAPIEFFTESFKKKKSIGNLKAVSALEPKNWDTISNLLEELMSVIEKEMRDSGGLFPPDYVIFCEQLQGLLYKGDALTELTTWLKSYDSVHLHQIANYFEYILRPMIGNIKNGREYLSEIKKVKTNIDRAREKKAQWEELVKSRNYTAMLTMSSEHLKKSQKRLQETLKRNSYFTNINTKIMYTDVLLKASKDGVSAVNNTLLEEAIEDFLIEDFGRSIEQAEYNAKYHSGEQRRSFNAMQIRAEFSKLTQIFALAFIIKNNGWHEVTFADTPTLDITNAWSIVKTKKDQVRNSARFDPAEMARFYSGSNMSGKTFHLKQLIWAILAAQATGFAPCDAMTSPIFDQVLYIDRVKAESDRNISAFGLEVKYWQKFFEHASQAGLVFGAVDEAGSTTSPKYQSALSYAIANEMLALGNMLAMASHNHDFLDAFHDANKDHAGIYHFKTRETKEGKIAFDYAIKKGHEPSNAIKIAEQLGLGMVTRLINEKSNPAPDTIHDLIKDHSLSDNISNSL
ncbi:MAG: hypothetical protein KKH08_02365 [Candidatus Omnitrophica bacterium]|nr:hypothetical protein [Candidatus Omnitrophota bacterium]